MYLYVHKYIYVYIRTYLYIYIYAYIYTCVKLWCALKCNCPYIDMYIVITVMPGVAIYANTCVCHVLSQQIDFSKTTRPVLVKQ